MKTIIKSYIIAIGLVVAAGAFAYAQQPNSNEETIILSESEGVSPDDNYKNQAGKNRVKKNSIRTNKREKTNVNSNYKHQTGKSPAVQQTEAYTIKSSKSGRTVDRNYKHQVPLKRTSK